jgi:hypothetical protein
VPEQIHINLANPSNDAVHSYSVAWATAEPTNTVVKFGDSADKLNRQVNCCSHLRFLNVHKFELTDACNRLCPACALCVETAGMPVVNDFCLV